MTPPLPNRKGKTTRRKYIDGSPMEYVVDDEIIHLPKNNDSKAIYFQKLRFSDDGRIEFRFCYYMIGRQARCKGKWVFGQFAPMINREDLEQILTVARNKGWIN